MVYVDDLNKQYGRMIMCHMIADNSYELIKMAKKIGVAQRHIQYPGTNKEHFDISKAAKLKALKYGALAVPRRQLLALIKAKGVEVRTYPFVVDRTRLVKIKANSLQNAINKVLALYPGIKVNTTFARNMEKYLTRINSTERVLTTKYNNGVMASSLISDEDFLEELLTLANTKTVTTKLKHKTFMELQKAIKKAKELSAKDKAATFYINVIPAGQPNEGDCEVEKEWNETTYMAYRNGSEIAVPVKASKAEKPTKENLKKAAKSSAASIDGKQNRQNMATLAKAAAKNSKAAAKTAAKTATKVAAKEPAKKAATAAPAPAPKGLKNMSIKDMLKAIKSGSRFLNKDGKPLPQGYLEKMKDHSRQIPVALVK